MCFIHNLQAAKVLSVTQRMRCAPFLSEPNPLQSQVNNCDNADNKHDVLFYYTLAAERIPGGQVTKRNSKAHTSQ